MEEITTLGKIGLLRKTLLILLAVVFFLFPFTLGFHFYATYIVSILILLIVIILSLDAIKKFDLLSLSIIVLPTLALGILYSLSYFGRSYYDIPSLIMIPFTVLNIVISGIVMAKGQAILLKAAIFSFITGIALISLINAIITIVKLGFFYGLIYPENYSYYDGYRSTYTLSSSAYALVGFSVKQVPINLYLLYPSALMISAVFYSLNDRKCKYNIIFSCSAFLVALFTFLVALSRVSLVNMLFVILVTALVTLFIYFPKFLNKPVKITFLSLLGISAVFAVLFIINAQSANVDFKEAISNFAPLNYLFNTNRYAAGMSIVLNNFFSLEKVIGFPVFYDYGYEKFVFPSANFLVNQFMYGGLFAIIFIFFIVGIFIYSFLQLKKLEGDRFNKYLPSLIAIIFFAVLFIGDVGNISYYENDFIPLSNVSNPIFLMMIMMVAYQYSNVFGGKKNEE